MKIVGLTGGIGSGKSTVLTYFKELGAATFIADIEAKQLMNTNAELIKEITFLFGSEAYKNGILNRSYISEIVFNNKAKLAKLNALVHPKVRAHFENFTKTTKAEIVIYEAAILFESGSHNLCDYVITVTADFEERIKRVMLRDQTDKEAVMQRIKHQLNDEAKVLKSDFVITNNTFQSAKEQVKTIFEILLKLN
ncbi:dephospho-CoA kinase [Lutibacter agarilyticus]|uniref:Dephospho-CoA kinase n=1 Tax=Lutibacter agarilyticus TaxID=1109740 RepID=A0A238XLJ8_9FLAO|nr:dephospho-CoA kinase [Lutibacter agarilyticus]SNR59552.1 dephospho-CoA kinase [Lutibacter agarilyticus]